MKIDIYSFFSEFIQLDILSFMLYVLQRFIFKNNQISCCNGNKIGYTILSANVSNSYSSRCVDGLIKGEIIS